MKLLGKSSLIPASAHPHTRHRRGQRKKTDQASFGTPKSVFEADRPALISAEMHNHQIDAILQFEAWSDLRKELAMLEQRGIRILFYTDPDYPRRLLSTPDFPPLLYYRGTANLNAQKVISVVGTRRPTDYGKQITDRLIRELAQPDCLIVSGLAFWHRCRGTPLAALQFQVSRRSV